MPTYEYECGKCGKVFEFFQTMSEPRKEKCEECDGKLTKLLSAGSGLIFKGSGFYITDYKNKGAESGAAKTDGETGATKAGNENKTDGGENKSPVETKKLDVKPAESAKPSPTADTSSSTKTE
ncbi:MAG: FmdB family zinc ribbon protein [Candidatus Sumerlaeaceae bacterium]